MARASALCTTGNVRPCLAISSAVAGSSSTDSAATLTPVWERLSVACSNARSCVLQYGHHEPRKKSTTPKSPAKVSGNARTVPPGWVRDRAGNVVPGVSSGITVLLDGGLFGIDGQPRRQARRRVVSARRCRCSYSGTAVRRCQHRARVLSRGRCWRAAAVIRPVLRALTAVIFLSAPW